MATPMLRDRVEDSVRYSPQSRVVASDNRVLRYARSAMVVTVAGCDGNEPVCYTRNPFPAGYDKIVPSIHSRKPYCVTFTF